MVNIRERKEENAMLARLIVRLLPVQAAIIAMGSINSIVDGVVAARFIDTTTVGVVGLYYTMLRVLEAAGGILLAGVTVLSGKYLGSGKVDKTRGITSLGLTLALIIGALLTVVSLAAPGWVSDVLGADAQLRGALSSYVVGYAFGIIPQLLGQQFASMLQLEHKENLGHVAVAAMIATNVLLDFLFVVVFKKGVFGLALATSLANWAYFLVTASFYLTKKAQLKPRLKLIAWGETFSVLKIGFSNALLVICLALRSLVLNRLLLTYAGPDGLSALGSFNMVIGLILAIGLGAGGLLRMLASIFLGEDNRESLRSLIRLLLTNVMAVMVGIAILVIVFSSALAGLFYTDHTSAVFMMTKQLFIIYSCGLPAAMVCIVFSNYYQAAGHLLFVNLISIMDGFVSSVVPALILAPRMGALGVWIAFLIGLFVTMIVSMLHPILRLKRWPKNLDEWMLLPPEFGSREHMVLHLHSMEDVTRTAQTVQTFCDEHGLPGKTGAHAGLCLEEIAANVVSHGFHKDRRRHEIEVRVVMRESDVLLRIKDDCKPFNPQEYYEMTSSNADPLKNVGIRLVYAIAREVEYQNLLGLNVLSIVADHGRGAVRPTAAPAPSGVEG